MKYVVWLLVLLLVILHQDIWNWTSDTLVFGFMPISLFYHSCLSVAASIVWLMACQFAWPAADDLHDGTELPSEEEGR